MLTKKEKHIKRKTLSETRRGSRNFSSEGRIFKNILKIWRPFLNPLLCKTLNCFRCEFNKEDCPPGRLESSTHLAVMPARSFDL